MAALALRYIRGKEITTAAITVAEKLKAIDGINSVKVETTYSPVWKMTRISRYGRIALGISPRGGK